MVARLAGISFLATTTGRQLMHTVTHVHGAPTQMVQTLSGHSLIEPLPRPPKAALKLPSPPSLAIHEPLPLA